MNMFINNYWFLPDKNRTGRKIKEIRELNGLSIYKFAQRIDTNYKTLYSWENGDAMPSLKNLKIIREEFNVSLEDLILPDSKFNNSDINNNELLSSNDFWYEKYFVLFFLRENGKEISLDEYQKLYDKVKVEKSMIDQYVRKIDDIRFDTNDYPVPRHKIDLNAIKMSFKQKKELLIKEDFNIQNILFSISNKDDELVKKFAVKYGESYNMDLNILTKNSIMYDYYKYKKFGTGLYNVLKNILYFNYTDIQISVVEALPPLYQEIFYNSLLFLDRNEFDNVLSYLEQNNCKKYRFCNNINIDDGYEHLDPFFKNSKSRMRQINVYHKALDSIRDMLIGLSYNEYLNERI